MYALACLTLLITYGIQRVYKSIVVFQNLFFSLVTADKSCLPMDDMKDSKKNFYLRYRWSILILILVLISGAILTTIFVIQTKRNSQPLVINTLNTLIISENHNVSDEEYVLIEFDECSFL